MSTPEGSMPRRTAADSYAIGRELYRQEQLAKARRELAETPPPQHMIDAIYEGMPGLGRTRAIVAAVLGWDALVANGWREYDPKPVLVIPLTTEPVVSPRPNQHQEANDA